MATTSPDNIWTPDSGDDYALTVDLAAMADTVQGSLNGLRSERIARSGTDAERLALVPPDLRDGLQWFSTDTGVQWRRVGGEWVSQGSDWITDPVGVLSPASGWSFNTFRIRKSFDSIFLYVSFDRTGGTISVGATGDIVNTPVGTLVAAWRPSAEMVLSSGNAGRVASGFVGSDGVVTLAAVGGSGDISQGATLSLGGVVLQ